MADGSLICIGKGHSDWNNSVPHGAGRALSRTQAKDKLTMQEYKRQMKNIFSSCVSISIWTLRLSINGRTKKR